MFPSSSHSLLGFGNIILPQLLNWATEQLGPEFLDFILVPAELFVNPPDGTRAEPMFEEVEEVSRVLVASIPVYLSGVDVSIPARYSPHTK